MSVKKLKTSIPAPLGFFSYRLYGREKKPRGAGIEVEKALYSLQATKLISNVFFFIVQSILHASIVSNNEIMVNS